MDNFDLYQERLKAFTTVSKDKLSTDKINTLKRALNSSYNSELVRVGDVEFQALINRIDTMPKIERNSFSTLVENNCEIGDIVYWVDKTTYWIIVEQLETDTAIFQGYIDKALYELRWKDLDTGIIYTQRACAKGPDQTVISDGVKHSIIFDNFTDSLYLMIPSDTEGIGLLTRYFEIMINGKKWQIEVVDNITKDKLVTLQLKEVAINRDTDTTTLVNGLVDVDFTLVTELDDIDELVLNSTVDLNPILYKNGIVDSASYVITTTNCTNTNGLITFNTLGNAVVQIRYPSLERTYRYTILVKASSAVAITNYELIGDEIVKVMSQHTYTANKTINGVAQALSGSWTINSDYFDTISSDGDSIILKALNKTGSVTLTFTYSTGTLTKVIKIIPMFGGNL